MKKQGIKEMEFCPLEFQKYVTRKLLKNQSHARILLKKHSIKEMKHSWLEICEQKIIEKIKYQRDGMLPVRNSEIWEKTVKIRFMR